MAASSVTVDSTTSQNSTLTLPEQKDIFVGKYGLLRRAYLKTHRKAVYTNLVTSGKLQEHLAEVDRAANDRLETIVSQTAKAQNISQSTEYQ